MGLTEYKRKRRFERTPEPAGETAARTGRSYVIQKHDASRLHYDFRLELDGVLKSWAVPKGPSLDPRIKRLAVQVEDHPVDYGTFEGIIPEGEYGGGTVLLWDRGTWEPIGDPHAGFRSGKLKFQLHGEKLQGGWMLVRSKGSAYAKSGKAWLLIKERDVAARSGSDGDILDELPDSVASGRDLDAIAAKRDAVRSSKPRARSRQSSSKKQTRRGETPSTLATKAKSRSLPTHKAPRLARGAIAKTSGAVNETMPATVDVELATLTKSAPEGDEWLHEMKFDGYRMICRIDGVDVRFITRNQLDWTDRLEPLVAAVKGLKIRQAILDGELVALQPDGTSDFQSLQNAFRDQRVGSLRYYVFDLLYLDGFSLVAATLEDRKRLLAELLSKAAPADSVQYSDHVKGAGEEFLRQACGMHLEGIISKRRNRPYVAGRGYDWLKTKCVKSEEFVIGGFTDPAGSRTGFGALLVGYHNEDGSLSYAGKVGTGFDRSMLKDLLERLKPLEQDESPFGDRRRKTGPARAAHWVKPELVAQIAFGSRTRDGLLRHAAFLGLREDKPAEEVVVDRAVPVKEAMQRSKRPRQTASTRSVAGSRPRKPSHTARRTKQPPVDDYDPRKQEFAGVRLTSPDKELYPEGGITKLDLAGYYRDIADWVLPHLAGRPLVLVRCPEGRVGACFYQKHPAAGTPEALRQIPIREKTKKEHYVVVDDVDGLISLAQIGALEVHAWGSRENKLERPDRLIFDLDPASDVAWSRVVNSAREMRTFLEELGLESFLKTTGGKGLHLVVPIDRRHDWDEVKAFCKLVADSVAAAAPQHYTSNMSKAARTGKIFIDYLRNGRGATAVVPYSTRARPGAPVSTPLTWKELSPRITSDQFHLGNIRRRLSSLKNDPWEGIDSVRQGLAGALKTLRAVRQ